VVWWLGGWVVERVVGWLNFYAAPSRCVEKVRE
jgi:hypothetical protein